MKNIIEMIKKKLYKTNYIDKSIEEKVKRINEIEKKLEKLKDSEIIKNFKNIEIKILNEIKENKKKKEEIKRKYLEEVFSLTREAAKRILNIRHFDSQIIGGIILNEGKIAEMKTGEGKTLAATLPAILNSMTGEKVYIITVNDYLAQRDAEWMGKIYKFFGIKIGVIFSNQSEESKKNAYSSKIIYAQNNELGFDFLRDNMKYNIEDYMQKKHDFAIIDEVDSVLIDEARTPLIISTANNSDLIEEYEKSNELIKKFKENIDYIIENKNKNIFLTEQGIKKSEKLLNLNNLHSKKRKNLIHCINQSLKANIMYKKNIDYTIQDNEIIIIDEHTGRLMHGRRWSDGLHQAIEKKENIKINKESNILASITFQNFFKMYKKLSGMTGTAYTEKEEFRKIYNMNTIIIPTNKKIIRKDEQDIIYKTEKEKLYSILNEIKKKNISKQPILIGTISVKNSESISNILKANNIENKVLNATNHKEESEIIAQAGRLKSVTIATNMAGRGTDIILGGDPEYKARKKTINKRNEEESEENDFDFLIGYSKLFNIETLLNNNEINNDLINKYKNYIQKNLSILLNNKKIDIKKTKKNQYINYIIKNIVYEKKKDFYKNSIKDYEDNLIEEKKICEKEKEKVIELGGLCIIGTERHNSRRIDNQLRGRSGRQGDPGESCFYLSLEDELLKNFGSEKIINMMNRLNIPDNVFIKNPMITNSIENAQKKIENRNFSARKQLLEYDNVINKQRQIIYSIRINILKDKKIEEKLIKNLLINEKNKNLETFENIKKNIKENEIKKIIKFMLLKEIDDFWKNHMKKMEFLKESIYFKGYANKDPKQEYLKEGFFLFNKMINEIQKKIIKKLIEIKKKINN